MILVSKHTHTSGLTMARVCAPKLTHVYLKESHNYSDAVRRKLYQNSHKNATNKNSKWSDIQQLPKTAESVRKHFDTNKDLHVYKKKTWCSIES